MLEIKNKTKISGALIKLQILSHLIYFVPNYICFLISFEYALLLYHDDNETFIKILFFSNYI